MGHYSKAKFVCIMLLQWEKTKTDLHLGKGAHVPWAILSVPCMQSASDILNY